MGGGKEECFPWGTWIDEGSKETEEALLWVCERRVEGLMCLLRDRQASFRNRHPLMPPQPSPPISSSFFPSFFHTAMPSGHWCIVGKKQQLKRQENTFFLMPIMHFTCYTSITRLICEHANELWELNVFLTHWEKVCPDQLLSGVKQTKNSQGEYKDKVLLVSENWSTEVLNCCEKIQTRFVAS